MNYRISKRALLRTVALNTAFIALTSQSLAHNNNAAADYLETIVVTGTRQAYHGDFEPLETPQAEQVLNQQILEGVTAFDLAEVSNALSLRFDVDSITNEEVFPNSFASFCVQPGALRTWRAFVQYSF